MYCSVIIPTIGRSTLVKSVQSALNQDFPKDEFEVIVVNDSGKPLAEESWQHEAQVRIITSNRRGRSVARNTGAAIATGQYFLFLDDDDWLLPHAMKELQAVAKRSPDAAWVYGGAQLVDESVDETYQLYLGMDGNVFAQVMGGEWIPIQSSLIKSEVFFKAGGYDFNMPAGEDIHLCRRIALQHDFAGTSRTVACILRNANWQSTTNYNLAYASNYKLVTRDAILDMPGVFARLMDSARTYYWRGRATRYYLASTLWNFKSKRFLVVTSRLLFCMASVIVANINALNPTFWKSVFQKDHFSRTVPLELD